MEWYLRNGCDDLILANDWEAKDPQHTMDVSPSTNDLRQWELSKNLNKCCGRYNKQTVEELGFEAEEASNSTGRGGSPCFDFGAKTLEFPCFGQPDFQQQNSMDWMDEIFLNSLLEDHENTERPLESLNMLDTRYKSVLFENPPSDMILDSQSLVKDPCKSEVSLSTCSFASVTDCKSEAWGKLEAGSPSFVMAEQSRRSEGPNTDSDRKCQVSLEPSSSNQYEEAVDELICSEATVLQELGGIMIQLPEQTRICFRDSLYRLARTSKPHQATGKFKSANGESSWPQGSGHEEPRTNVIDRAVAKLMFDLSYRGPAHHGSMENDASSGFYYSPEQLRRQDQHIFSNAHAHQLFC